MLRLVDQRQQQSADARVSGSDLLLPFVASTFVLAPGARTRGCASRVSGVWILRWVGGDRCRVLVTREAGDLPGVGVPVGAGARSKVRAAEPTGVVSSQLQYP